MTSKFSLFTKSSSASVENSYAASIEGFHEKSLAISRRLFLQGTILTTAGLMLPSVSMAQPQWQLPGRAGKPVLPLHYNENSLGMSAKALAAAQNALATAGNRYPDKAVGELRSLLARQNGVTEEQILFGNGSSELLGAAVALMAKTDRNTTIVEPVPTFGGVRGHAKTHGLKVESVPVGEGFVTDIAALRSKAESIKGSVLVNICNPNNPTGTIVDSDALTRWIMDAPDNVMFLVDEAYYEYAAQSKDYKSSLDLVKQGKENLFVTRTFSKIYGMAGMRIGYGFAAPKTAARLTGFSADWNLNIGGIAAAIASLQDSEFYQYSLKSNQTAKAILLATLDELKLAYIPSYTNFILHKIGSDLDSYNQKMQANNIKVGRRMTAEDNWNRLSVGTPEQMLEFSQTLRAFRERGWV